MIAALGRDQIGRPVATRANLIAASTASAPEFERKQRVKPAGAISAISLRSSARTSL